MASLNWERFSPEYWGLWRVACSPSGSKAVPLGAIGITVICALLSRAHLGYGSIAAQLSILGFLAGFFAVPINALIQHRPPPDRKGAFIAAANLLSFAGIALQPVAQYSMIRL